MSSTTTARRPGDPTIPRCATPRGVRCLRTHTERLAAPAASATAVQRGDRPLVGGDERDALAPRERQRPGQQLGRRQRQHRQPEHGSRLVAVHVHADDRRRRRPTRNSAPDPGQPEALAVAGAVLPRVGQVRQQRDHATRAGAPQRVREQGQPLQVARWRSDRPDEHAPAPAHSRRQLRVQLAVGEVPDIEMLHRATPRVKRSCPRSTSTRGPAAATSPASGVPPASVGLIATPSMRSGLCPEAAPRPPACHPHNHAHAAAVNYSRSTTRRACPADPRDSWKGRMRGRLSQGIIEVSQFGKE